MYKRKYDFNFNNQEVVCTFCILYGVLYVDFEPIGNVVFIRFPKK